MIRYSIGASLDRWGRLQDGVRHKPQYLGFTVGAFRLGIPLLRFAEVRNLGGIVPIMRPPDYRRGQAVIYGQTVPLLDLRVELECTALFTAETCVLFAWRRVNGLTESQVGLIVDSVETVVSVDEDELEMMSEIGSSTQAAHVLGVAIEGAHRRVLLDLDHWIEE